jgi:putative transposase
MIDKFEPPSKIFHVCGYHNYELTLKDREWKYPDCKTKHDRRITTATNIKEFSIIDHYLIVI